MNKEVVKKILDSAEAEERDLTKEEVSQILEYRNAVNLLKELSMYKWDEKSKTGDKPIKENDHACDAMRYLVKTVVKKWVFRTLEEEE